MKNFNLESFKEFLKDVNVENYLDKIQVLKEYLLKANEKDISKIFKMFPDYLKRNEDIILFCLDICAPDCIDELYFELDLEDKLNLYYIQIAFDKCNEYSVEYLFQEVPFDSEFKRNINYLKEFFKKYKNISGGKIYDFLHPDDKINIEFLNLIIENSYSDEVFEIFLCLPFNLKRNPEIIFKVLDKCKNTIHLNYCFKVLKYEDKRNDLYIRRALENSSPGFLLNFYNVLEKEDQVKEEYIRYILGKIDKNHIDFFNEKLNKLKKSF